MSYYRSLTIWSDPELIEAARESLEQLLDEHGDTMNPDQAAGVAARMRELSHYLEERQYYHRGEDGIVRYVEPTEESTD